MSRSRPVLLAVLAAVLVGGCSDDRPAVGAGDPTAEPTARLAQQLETVDAVLDGVPLTLEVADDPQERAVGLMGRTQVPAGTGMVFRFAAPDTVRFYMFNVPVPLRAVFVRDGAVVAVIDMPPCTEQQPSACPTYGPDEPVDTVVETAPETLPDVAPGDRLELSG